MLVYSSEKTDQRKGSPTGAVCAKKCKLLGGGGSGLIFTLPFKNWYKINVVFSIKSTSNTHLVKVYAFIMRSEGNIMWQEFNAGI